MSSIDFYSPYATTKEKDQMKQAMLTQVLLPQISNNSNKDLFEFFKGKKTNLLDKKFLNDSSKIVSLNSAYGCDLETQLRFMWSKDRVKHIEFMQSIRPEQLAVLVPYARFYVSDNAVNAPNAVLKNALPVAFDKSFDTNYFKSNLNNISRGEAAGIKSIRVNKAYNVTADYDPITLNASFFFSSYDVLMNKPAIDREYLFGFSYGGNRAGAATRRWNFNNFSLEEVKNISYKELLTISGTGKFKLFLEYGWSVPTNVSSELISPSEKALIEKFEKVFYAISPVTHNIGFNEDGSFSLDVEYVPVPIRTLTETNDFKASFFSDSGLFNMLKDDLRVDHAGLIKEIEEKQTKIKNIKAILKAGDKDPQVKTQLNKSIKRLEAEIKGKARGPVYTKAIIQALNKNKKYTLSYSIGHEEGILKSPTPEVTVANYTTRVYVKIDKIKEGKPVNSAKFQKEYTLPSFMTKIENYGAEKKTRAVQFAVAFAVDDALEAALIKEKVPKFLENGKMVSHILKNVLPETIPSIKDTKMANPGLPQSQIAGWAATKKDIYATQINFVFLKDFLDLMYRFVDGQNGMQLPVCILGNIAAPLPNGYKYWCNIGDIPIEINRLTAILSNFFNKRPMASLNDLLHYILQTAVPDIMTNPETRSGLPTISFPYFNFQTIKWLSDSKIKPTLLNQLLRGEEKALISLSEKYFNDSAFGAGLGCIFVGQTSSLQHENSNVFISKRIEAFSQNFFNNEKKIIDAGIGKLVIGASDGLLISMNFGSNTDASLKNLNYEFSKTRGGGSAQIISANFQYTMNATLFGNRIYEFSNLVFVPSYSLGKMNPSVSEGSLDQLKTDDFEIAGLYAVASVTDNLDLTTNTYRKTITGNTVLRESRLIINQLKYGGPYRRSPDAKMRFPALANTSLSVYVLDNADEIDILKPRQKDLAIPKAGPHDVELPPPEQVVKEHKEALQPGSEKVQKAVKAAGKDLDSLSKELAAGKYGKKKTKAELAEWKKSRATSDTDTIADQYQKCKDAGQCH